MTPSRLQTFLAIVDTGSARSAAQSLRVTESAVSASLASLQHELEVPLFERLGRRLVLTESGEIFAGYARRILGLMEESMSAARSGVSADHGTIRLGAVTTAGEYLLPGLLASFRARWPAVDVTLEVGVRDRVMADLADHRLDVVIAGRPGPGRGLVTRAMRRNALVVVSAPGVHEDLSTATWLLREEGSGTRATTLALHEELGIAPPTLSLGSHGAVVSSAVLGLGVTLVSMDAVGRDLDEGRLEVRTTSKTPLKRPWHVLTGTSPTATARLFIDHLLSHESGLEFKRPPRSVVSSRL
jgi:DNA-binding transcriptional LysR family regulator